MIEVVVFWGHLLSTQSWPKQNLHRVWTQALVAMVPKVQVYLCEVNQVCCTGIRFECIPATWINTSFFVSRSSRQPCRGSMNSKILHQIFGTTDVIWLSLISLSGPFHIAPYIVVRNSNVTNSIMQQACMYECNEDKWKRLGNVCTVRLQV